MLSSVKGLLITVRLTVYGVDKHSVGKPLYLQNMGLVNNEVYEMSSI